MNSGHGCVSRHRLILRQTETELDRSRFAQPLKVAQLASEINSIVNPEARIGKAGLHERIRVLFLHVTGDVAVYFGCKVHSSVCLLVGDYQRQTVQRPLWIANLDPKQLAAFHSGHRAGTPGRYGLCPG